MLRLCITFDYELFLGENWKSEEEVLFEPSMRLSELLKVEGVPATFFADVCSVMRYQVYNQVSFCEGFSRQIGEFVQAGHDVQLHMHPNWLKSSFENGKWSISIEGYKLHEFGLEKGGYGRQLIREGKEYLENMLKAHNPDYRCIAYRAGGFCISPEKELFEALRENDIIIDASVAQKQVAAATIQDYNFSKIPSCLNWWVDPSVGIRTVSEKSENNIYEVCIGGVKNSLVKFFGIPIRELHVHGRSGYGDCMKIDLPKSTRIAGKLKSLKRRLWSYGILSLDTRGYKVLIRDINELYRKYDCKRRDQYVCIICHPKLASNALIYNMQSFVREVKKYPDKYGFATMTDIVKDLNI